MGKNNLQFLNVTYEITVIKHSGFFHNKSRSISLSIIFIITKEKNNLLIKMVGKISTSAWTLQLNNEILQRT